MAQKEELFNELCDGLLECDAGLVESAYKYADEKHSGQKRDVTNDDYIVHPLRVAIALKKFGIVDGHSLAIALLHDVGEDGAGEPLVEIDHKFGRSIFYGVYMLTKPKTARGKNKDPLQLADYFRKIAEHPDLTVRLIKVLDRIDNLSDFRGWKPERRERYIAETKEHVLPIARTCGERVERKMLSAIKNAAR